MMAPRSWTTCHRFIGVVRVGFVFVACALVQLQPPANAGAPITDTADANAAAPSEETALKKKRAVVLSWDKEPGGNTSQGLYIEILGDAGFEARAVHANEVRNRGLQGCDIFIIGGGSGYEFNESLGADGGKTVEEFVRRGGGFLGSCAGGYSVVRGGDEEGEEALSYIDIAKARCIDDKDGRWARGSGVVEIAPADDRYSTLKMWYGNGPLWEIIDDKGPDQTVALAHFLSDIKEDDDPGGIMPGTPAILAGTFGDGRFVLFSGHPEFYEDMGNRPILADAARWVTRGRLKADESIRWADVFPNSEKTGAETANPASARPDDDNDSH